ncbi:MAG: hypothetical protein WCZ17_11045 [Candidatus Kapaibacterium sp.]|jgi:hypothetical protein|nr:hypothetical protein [Candidatus Kapabacteria bacterium]
MFLEIFRTGEHTDSSGIKGEFSIANLDTMAENFRRKSESGDSSIAPVVAGHPTTNSPAVGWVKRLFRRGTSLIADVDFVDDNFKQSIIKGEYKNVSIAIDENLNLIHLGFLGAVRPAVEGLDPFKYSAVSEFSTINDSELIIIDDIRTNERLTELEQINHTYAKQLDEYKKQLLEKENTEFFNSLNQNGTVKNFSKNQETNFRELLEIAATLDSETDKKDFYRNKVKGIITAFAESLRKHELGVSLIDNDIHFSKGNINSERNLIHKNAVRLMMQNPSLSYEDAVSESI